jgi:hypothetical protein
MSNKCPASKYTRNEDEDSLHGDPDKLRTKGSVALQDNVRGRADRYKQLFVAPGSTKKGRTKHSAADIARYKDTSAKNWRAGSTPYKNEAHHVLITDLVTKWRNEDHFHYEILNEGLWDQNNGENNIFLPNEEHLVKVHLLPLHRGAHKANYPRHYPNSQYRKDVERALRKLAAEFSNADPCEEGDNNFTKVQQFLNDRADELWRKLAKCQYGGDLGRNVESNKRLANVRAEAEQKVQDWGNPSKPYGPASYK